MPRKTKNTKNFTGEPERCSWPGADELMRRYHDEEWGVPLFNDQKLYEFLVLETFQAGLSWRTVLHKRQNFKRAFANFDFKKVAQFGAPELKRLLANAGIIRNRAKILAAINNAQKFLEVRREFGRFSKYMWGWSEAEAWSKDLKKRGFKFLGPTVVYAHMQAVGMVNDHTANCYRYRELQNLKK